MTLPVDGGDRETVLRAYCLGVLREDDRDRLEAELVADADVLEEVDATADDLIRDYLAGALGSDDRARFEAFFLASPRRRERVAFVRDLMAATRRARPQVQPRRGASRRWSWPVAAALAAALAGIIAFALWRGRAAAPQTVDAPVAAPSAAPSSVPTDRATVATPRVARLDLPAVPRGVVAVALDGTATLHVRVAVRAPIAPGYSVSLRQPGRPPAWEASDLVPDARGLVAVSIPAAPIQAGDYELVVEGDTARDVIASAPRPARYRLTIRR